MAISLKVNGATRSVEAEPDTPLLYVLRNDFELNGAKFGCGLG
jgi:aerobic-type carbon monoxide dehydrogenase small subunit (CoxS/CutS family)